MRKYIHFYTIFKAFLKEYIYNIINPNQIAPVPACCSTLDSGLGTTLLLVPWLDWLDSTASTWVNNSESSISPSTNGSSESLHYITKPRNAVFCKILFTCSVKSYLHVNKYVLHGCDTGVGAVRSGCRTFRALAFRDFVSSRLCQFHNQFATTFQGRFATHFFF